MKPSAVPERTAAPRVVPLLPPPRGDEPDRVLRVSFGRFLENVLAAGVDPRLPAPDGETFYEHLASLARGADLIHDIASGHPAMDGNMGPPPNDLAGYFLSLGDRDIGAAHSIAGFDADWGLDPHGERLRRMVRLTDYLDPEGHTFDAHFGAVLDAEPAEDPGPARSPGRDPERGLEWHPKREPHRDREGESEQERERGLTEDSGRRVA